MKICVIGNGMIVDEFKNLQFSTINIPFEQFDVSFLKNYDTVINTYDYGKYEDDPDMLKMIKCNVEIPRILSKFCKSTNKRLIHISTSDLYESDIENTEDSNISSSTSYEASKLLGETVCNLSRDVIIRTRNVYSGMYSEENALYQAITNTRPSKNKDSYTWSVDLIRGIVAILRNKKTGIFNIASNTYLSQADICKEIGMRNIAPTTDNSDSYRPLNTKKLNKYFMPSNINNIIHCYTELENDSRD
jgi:dTDP-4-dehydrorhamnose reductase